MPRPHHRVYVVELDPAVLREKRFRDANPSRDPEKPCIYVGMTGLDPDTRFDNHKAGYRANRYVRDYGLRLRPDLYEEYDALPYGEAAEMEEELARILRRRGYAVWQK